MKIISAVAIILVLLTVCVGAFNVVNDTNNRPLTSFEFLQTLGDLNTSFIVSTTQLKKAEEDFKALNEEQYKLSDEYVKANVFEKFMMDWKNNSVVLRILLFASHIIYFIIGALVDVIILAGQLFSFGYKLIFGVPT